MNKYQFHQAYLFQDFEFFHVNSNLLFSHSESIGTEKLQYICVGESGPDHAKVFDVEVKLSSNVVGKGQGKTKREAEQNAAKEALLLFDVK